MDSHAVLKSSLIKEDCLKHVLDKLCPGVDYSSRDCEFNVSETTLLVNKVSADRRAQKT